MKPRKVVTKKEIVVEKPPVASGKPKWCNNRPPLQPANLSKLANCAPIAASELPVIKAPPKPKSPPVIEVNHVKRVIDVKIAVITEASSPREKELRAQYQKEARNLHFAKLREQQGGNDPKIIDLTPQALWSKYRGTLQTFRSLERTGKWSASVKDEKLIDIAVNQLDRLWPYVAAMALHVNGCMFLIEQGETDFAIADLDIADVPDYIDDIESHYLVSYSISQEL